MTRPFWEIALLMTPDALMRLAVDSDTPKIRAMPSMPLTVSGAGVSAFAFRASRMMSTSWPTVSSESDVSSVISFMTFFFEKGRPQAKAFLPCDPMKLTSDV